MRTRLFLSFCLVVLVAVAIVAFITRLGAANEVRSFMLRGAMTGSGGLAQSLVKYYIQNGSWQGVESLLPSPTNSAGGGVGAGMMANLMMGQRLRLANSRGVLVADSSQASVYGSLTKAELKEAIQLKYRGKIVGYLLAQGGMGLTPGDERFLLNRLSRAAFLAVLVAGSLSLLLSVLLTYNLLKPVRELTQAAKNLAKGDLSQRVTVQGEDELAALGSTFNQMADTLQKAEESRRAMTADIAHELRTPLAIQRANLEALQDGVYPLNPDNLGPILEQNQLLTRLVEDLRTLALVDAGQLELVRAPTDLPALVDRIVERFIPRAVEQMVNVIIDKDELPTQIPDLSLDAMRIEQILNNLLTNALRYSPTGSQITVHLSETPKSIRVSVLDQGPGIPTDAQTHIFERFYRADRSRSRAEGGSGLGLTIARQLARAHGGDLSADDNPQGGANFTLSLPLPQS